MFRMWTSSKRAQKEMPSQRERLPPSAEKKLPSWIEGNILARMFDTNPQIVVLLVRHRLLHQTAVEHIDFEQVKIKGFLRHIIKGSCCLLHKVFSKCLHVTLPCTSEPPRVQKKLQQGKSSHHMQGGTGKSAQKPRTSPSRCLCSRNQAL